MQHCESVQDLLASLRASLTAAEQPTAASEASPLAETLLTPQAADFSVSSSAEHIEVISHDLISRRDSRAAAKRSTSTKRNSSTSAQSKSLHTWQATPVRTASKASRYLQANGGFTHAVTALPHKLCIMDVATTPNPNRFAKSQHQLQPKCSLADSCSSFLDSLELAAGGATQFQNSANGLREPEALLSPDTADPCMSFTVAQVMVELSHMRLPHLLWHSHLNGNCSFKESCSAHCKSFRASAAICNALHTHVA